MWSYDLAFSLFSSVILKQSIQFVNVFISILVIERLSHLGLVIFRNKSNA
jgi:hypothetical protein